MAQRWTCAKCERQFTTDSIVVPVRCRCGHVDRDGSCVTVVEDQPVSTSTAKVKRYVSAVARWVNAGRPVRTDAEVDQILADHCCGCRWFSDHSCTHSSCGCQVRSVEEERVPVLSRLVPAAMLNKLRMATERCPEEKWGVPKVDVVVLLTAANPLWDISPAISRIGFTTETIDLQSNRIEEVRRIVETRAPKLVVNRSFCVGWDVVEKLSDEYPQTQFVTVNHSSQAHLLTHAHWLRAQSEFLRLAMERENCWLASPDERVPLREATGCERAIWLPNLVELPPYVVTRNRPKVPVVSLVGRRDLVKNFPTQILAAGIVNRRKPIKLLIVTRGNSDDFARLAEQCGVEADVFQWDQQRDYLRLIGQRVDVGLQASFSESFNYVALDHLGLGIPVVGSPAIRYLPREWQASPDDPSSIALTLARVLDDRDAGGESRRIADMVAGRNERAFAAVIRSLVQGFGNSGPLNNKSSVSTPITSAPTKQETHATT